MQRVIAHLYLIPLLPLLAAGVLALTPQRCRRFAVTVSVGAMVLAFALACAAFSVSLQPPEAAGVFPSFHNFPWFQLGGDWLRLGWVMDPLAGVMIVMVTFVGLLIFLFSVGYMAHDPNYTRFFCFLSLFAAAMLGVVIANSLLLLFICWELMGFASYILIGFWFQKPSAAAAAKKAFIVTRLGDLGLFLGMLWLYSQTGTLLFYDQGKGCLEIEALRKMMALTVGGMTVSTGIALLIFCGAIGKSGQLPLHVWLPDAMEGPTPVSALIHAATMVAAGVFLVARVFPVFEASNLVARSFGGEIQPTAFSPALIVVAWTGALTAVVAALMAVAQYDIKRILAYSTISQLGYMFLGLGTGGVAVGLFHLITHAFFKALLFLGAGSVIHGCHEQQDIRHLGGLRKLMPVTFATYAIGVMALCGVPLFFSGFWSKDEILHAALHWEVSQGPFYLGMVGAFLTAFYMTRQMLYVFFGRNRGQPTLPLRAPLDSSAGERVAIGPGEARADTSHHAPAMHPHESPPVMTGPLLALAAGAVLLSIIGTPAWPWFHNYLAGAQPHVETSPDALRSVLWVMVQSSFIAAAGIWLGWRVYRRRVHQRAEEADPLERRAPGLYAVLASKFRVDEFYHATVVRLNAWSAQWADWLDRRLWSGVVNTVAGATVFVAWVNRLVDELLVNLGFDKSCGSLRAVGRAAGLAQNGQVQRYLRAMTVGLIILALIIVWGLKR